MKCLVGIDEPFCLGQNTAIINSSTNFFIYCSLLSSYSIHQIEEKVGGSTQKTITLKDIRELSILVPSNQEFILKFEKCVNPIFEKIFKNSYSITYLTKIRNIILPKLMSGEIRV